MWAGRWLGSIPFDPGRVGQAVAPAARHGPLRGKSAHVLSELPSRKSLAKFPFWICAVHINPWQHGSMLECPVSNMEQSIVVDKSTMQMLSPSEADWMHTFFSNVIPSIYLMELLGNLKKDWGEGRDAKEFLASMASKTYGMHTYHNIDYRELITHELAGHHINMSRRPLVGGAQAVTDSRGKSGYFFDVAPESKDLMRWSEKRFTAAEEGLSEEWRNMLRQLDKTDSAKASRRKLIGKITSVSDAVNYADNLMERDTWRSIKGIYDMFDIDRDLANICKIRWNVSGKPHIKKFLPYTAHILRVNLVYDISMTFELVPDRETNIIDLQYLYF
jgi:hypothetical protein